MINSLQESDSKLLFVFIEGAFFFFFLNIIRYPIKLSIGDDEEMILNK